MKSTYRLLSIYLDRKPIPVDPPVIGDLSKLDPVQNISEEYNLFDLQVYQRKIDGSILLSSDDYSFVTNIMDQHPWCGRIYIVLDYTTKATVAVTLYVKRILQVVRMLQDRYPQKQFMIVAQHDCLEQFRYTLAQIYA